MSFQTDLWVSVYDACTREMLGGVDCYLYEVATGETLHGVTASSGANIGTWKVGYVNSGQFNLALNLAGYGDFLQQYGVGGEFQEISAPLMPVGGCPSPPPDECEIWFTVKDSAGVPIQGAIVDVTGYDTFSGQTNASGIISFLNMPLGGYTWLVSKNGYVSEGGSLSCSVAGEVYQVNVFLGLPHISVTLQAVGNGGLGFEGGSVVTNQTYDLVVGDYVVIAVPDANHYFERWIVTNADYPSGRNWGNSNPLGIHFYIDTLLQAVFLEEIVPPECVTDADCPAGYICVGGVCIPETPPPNLNPVSDPNGPYEVDLGDSVQFNGDGSYDPDGSIVSYEWHFGDGGTSSQKNPSHTYADSGTFTVSLKVTDNNLATNTAFTLCTVIGPGDVPVNWNAPTNYVSGVYKWSIKFNIVPIPFLDNWIVDLVAGMQDDENNLNSIMAGEGATGTATIIRKELTKHTNWLGNVDNFTIIYTVAFEGSLLPSARAGLFPWVALVPYIPHIIGLVSLIVIGLIINNVTSSIVKIVGPKCYTPKVAGQCATSYIWDAETGECCSEGLNLNMAMLVGGGIILLTLLAKKK